MMESEQLHYRFGGIDIDLSNLRVTVNGEVRTLEPKSFRLLQFLIENRGRAVPKDEMLSAVWTDTAVTDNALTRAVAQIRKALDDDPKEPRYVETIPTVGYRFLPQCEVTSAFDEAPNAAGRQRSRAWGAVAVAISLLGGGWLLARLSSVPRTAATFVSTAQLTSSHGLDIDAAWSPEGSLVAYASDVSGQFEIYVRSRDAAARTLQLTNDGNQNLTPSFSPDGRFVAYSCMAKPGIYRIPALGGSGQRLTDFGSQPKWSPDGQWIAFISNAKPSLSTTDYYFGANSALWLVSAAGGAAKQLTSETFDGAQTFPSWSSDSREIRFVNYIGQTPSVWTYRMADGRLEKRFEGPSGTTFGDAVFSRDSLRMYYVKSDLNGDIEIWMQPLGRETLRPSKDAEPLFRPTLGVPRGLSLSPDGKRLAFTATLAESKVLMRKVTNGSFDDAPATEVTHETTYRYALPHWSPDGQSVIYTKFEKGQLARTLLDRLDGSTPRMLGQGTSPEVYPLFTTDGKHVLVVAPDARMRVVVREISVVDGAIRELAGAVDMVFPSLSPDGGAVIYHNQAEPFTHLYRLDLKTGTRTQLTFGDLSSGFGYFSPDGTWITFEFNLRGRDELAVIPAQGGEARVFWNEPGYWYAAGWIPSTDQVLAAGNRGSGWALYAIDVKAKTARQLSKELPLRMYLRYPEMSRDGKRIAYEFNESRGNVFVGELP